MSDNEGLRKALSKAQRYLNDLPTPPNEANTCDWVIRPLLLALGYEDHEILAQAGDSAREFPDYTILPKTGHTWYLEAKAWSVELDSAHVDQSLNYAHRNGNRWVVLSNGRAWRLYDDEIKGKNPDRLVASAVLDDTQGMCRFLAAISRDSMLAKKVEDYASERRIRDYLTGAISNPTSPVISAILKVVRQQLGNGNIKTDAIVDILNAALSAPAVTPQPPAAPHANSEVARKETYGPLFLNWKEKLKAEGWLHGTKLTVKKGARVAKEPVKSYRPVFEKKIPPLIVAGMLVDRGDYLELMSDLEFGSPSGASDFVFGASTNGWDQWKDTSGVKLNKLRPRTREEAPWLFPKD